MVLAEAVMPMVMVVVGMGLGAATENVGKNRKDGTELRLL